MTDHTAIEFIVTQNDKIELIQKKNDENLLKIIC